MATFLCYTCPTVALLPASCRVARVIQPVSFIPFLPIFLDYLSNVRCFLKRVIHLRDMAGRLLPAALGLASHILVIQDLNDSLADVVADP